MKLPSLLEGYVNPACAESCPKILQQLTWLHQAETIQAELQCVMLSDDADTEYSALIDAKYGGTEDTSSRLPAHIRNQAAREHAGQNLTKILKAKRDLVISIASLGEVCTQGPLGSNTSELPADCTSRRR